MNRLQSNLLLLLTAAIWGGGFIAQSTAMDAISPFWFVGIRFLIAALVTLPFALHEAAKSQAPISRKQYLQFSTVGLALFGGVALQQVGIMFTSVTNSGFLTSLYVIFVPVIAVLVLRRPPHWVIWPASFGAFGGIFLLSGGNISTLNFGDMLTILCAFFWALQVILIGVFVGPSGRPLALSCTQFAICGLVGCVIASIFEPISLANLVGSWKELLYVGVVSSGLAFTLQTIGQRYTTAAQASIFLSTEALFSALFASLLLGERLVLTGYIGCLLMFISVLAVEIVPELKRKVKPTP